MVHIALVGGIDAQEGLIALDVHVVDSLMDALAQVVVLVAVAQLDRLEGARGCTGRDDGAPDRTVIQQDVDLDRGIATGIQDLATVDVDDIAHFLLLLRTCVFTMPQA